MLGKLTKKIQSYHRLYEQERERRRTKQEWEQSVQRVQQWIKIMESNPPMAYVGDPLCNGGVKNHILAIKKHSSLPIALIPDSDIFPDRKHFKWKHIPIFNEFTPKQGTIHSHVMPWIIRWGKQCQEQGLRWVHTYHLNYSAEHSEDLVLNKWQIEINDALLDEAPRADIRLAVARWHQQELLNEHSIESYYLPNGVDLSICDQADADRFTQKTGRRNFLLYVGRDDPVKNPAAFAKLAANLPEREFLMIGGGLSEDVLNSKYDQETPENLIIHGGEDRMGVQDAIAACSALVVTSYREGLPTLVLEAMAQNKPIVVPTELGCMEAIDQGRCGFIYQQDDIDDLVRQTRLALADNERRALARPRVIKEYDWKRIARTLDYVYREPNPDRVYRQLAQWPNE